MPNCVICGAYAGEEHWRKWCRRCYAKKKRDEESSPYVFHEPTVDDLRNALATLHKQYCELLDRKNGDRLDEDFIRRLLMLCHPDKHGGSSLSTQVTQKLLEMRDGYRS